MPTLENVLLELKKRLKRVRVDDETRWLAEGDLLLTDQELKSYARRLKRTQDEQAGTAPKGLVLDLTQAGLPNRHPFGRTLRYTVSRDTFPDEGSYQRAVDAMAAATQAWELTANLRFAHESVLDGQADVPIGPAAAPSVDAMFRVVFSSFSRPDIVATSFFPDQPAFQWKLRIGPAWLTSGFDPVGVLRHEIGHILGFRHEHIRSGAPAICPDESTDVQNLGVYDPHSVMHYFCGDVGSRTLELTDLDRQGARVAYPFAGDPDFEAWKAGNAPTDGPQVPTSATAFLGTQNTETVHVWQGMSHQWRFVPHRINGIYSLIDASNQKAVIGQNTGNDPDTGELTLHYQTVSGVSRRESLEIKVEAVDDCSDPAALIHASGNTTVTADIVLNADEVAVVVWQGYSWDITTQDTDGQGTPRSIWPVEIDLHVTHQTVEGQVQVTGHFAVTHGDSPDLLKKPENLPYKHAITIRADVLVFPAASVVAVSTDTSTCTATQRGLLQGVVTRQQLIPHDQACLVGIAGITLKLAPGQPAGRYLQSLGWALRTHPVPTGTLLQWQAGASADVGVSPTRYDTGISLQVVQVATQVSSTMTTTVVQRTKGHHTESKQQEVALDPGVLQSAAPDALVALTAAPAAAPTPSGRPPFVREAASKARPPRGSYAGAASAVIRVPDGVSMAGHAVLAKKGRHVGEDLKVRAVYLEDEDGNAVAFVVAELWSASRYVHEHLARALRNHPCGLAVHQIVLLGTHTHNAPGGYLGNSLYDGMGSAVAGFRTDVADAIIEAATDAVSLAWKTSQPAKVSFDHQTLWGVAWNRSLPAFQAVKNDWTDAQHPGHGAPDLPAEQRAIDPRVHRMSVWDLQGRRIAVLAAFGCHNTAIGAPSRETAFYTADWAGAAARTVEGERGAECALIALSSAGDVTPLPLDGSSPAGPGLVAKVGRAVADSVLAPDLGAREPIRLQAWFQDWYPADGALDDAPQTRLAAWCSGVPSIAGAEDARSCLFPWAAKEGMTGDDFAPGHPQHPKVEALGILGALLKEMKVYEPSPVHPLQAVRVNDHLFATVPGEPTVQAAWRIEQALIRVTAATSATILGYAGDYAGYFTTKQEFAAQHYEGASTIYGSESVNHLATRLSRLVRSAPWSPPPSITAGFKAPESVQPDAALVAVDAGLTRQPLTQRATHDGDSVTLLQIWDAENAPATPPTARLWTLHHGQPAPDDTPATVLSDDIWAPDGHRVVWTATWQLPYDTRGLAFWLALAPSGDLRAPVVGLHCPAPDEPPTPALAAPRDQEDDLKSAIELIRVTQPDRYAAAIAALTPRAALNGLRDPSELSRDANALLAGARTIRSEALVADSPLPDGFTFEGYDPDAIPVDPTDRRFEEWYDWEAYVSWNAIAFHLGVMELAPVRRPADYASGLQYRIAAPTPERPVDIAIFGDFGNGLYASRYIAAGMARYADTSGLAAAIHLGDVYYAGTHAEFTEHLEGPLDPLARTTPVFILPGNHDLYSGGGEFHAYLDRKKARYPQVQTQEGATFCLDAGPFRIVGADTEWWKHGRMSGEVQRTVLTWLTEARRDGRTTILCTSQHGWDFGKRATTDLLERDLAPILGAHLVDVWFWGNVHHAALYEPHREHGYIACCAGWSDYPYERIHPGEARHSAQKVSWAEYGNRFAPNEAVRPDVGNNGWVRAMLHADGSLELVFIDWMGQVRHSARITPSPNGPHLG